MDLGRHGAAALAQGLRARLEQRVQGPLAPRFVTEKRSFQEEAIMVLSYSTII